jgi:small subunit ribosomal protein S6
MFCPSPTIFILDSTPSSFPIAFSPGFTLNAYMHGSIARTAGSLILSSGGTIRALSNWGVSSLPKRTRKHQAIYHEGHYFIMRYDASSAVQDNVRKTLGLDPRMIKFSSVKLGDGTLESLSKVSAKIPWAEREMR